MPRPRFLARSLSALALALAFSPPALAQSAADKAAADALFDDAKKLMKQKKWDEACPKLAESMRLSERLGTLLNLATCHAEQGKTASAWAEFKEAAAMAKREKSKPREKLAKDEADALEKRLARVKLVLPKSLENATLELDGTQIGASAAGTALPIDPGKHEVKVSAPGRKTWSKELVIEDEAGVTTLEVPELEPESAAKTPVPAPSEPAEKPAPREPELQKSSGGGSTLGWVVLGVGVVGVGVGSYFGLRTFSKKSDSDDHCGAAIGQSDPNRCDQAGVDLREQAKSAGMISTLGFAVGAAGVGTGVILLLTSSGGGTKEKAGRHTQVLPLVGARGGGAVIEGRF